MRPGKHLHSDYRQYINVWARSEFVLNIHAWLLRVFTPGIKNAVHLSICT